MMRGRFHRGEKDAKMVGFVAGIAVDSFRTARQNVCGRRGGAVCMAAPGTSGGFRGWEVEEDGKVSVPSPFGVVRRDLQELAPMVLMAAEMQNLDMDRLVALKKVLADPSSSSSQMLATVAEMRFFPPETVVPSLLECLRTTPDELTRSQIIWTLALFRQGDDDCWKAILNELEDLSSPTVSSAAAGALGYVGDPDAITPLVRAYTMSSDFIVQMSAIVSLGSIGDASILPQLLNWLSQYDSEKVWTGGVENKGPAGRSFHAAVASHRVPPLNERTVAIVRPDQCRLPSRPSSARRNR